jgi:hypothetical protein
MKVKHRSIPGVIAALLLVVSFCGCAEKTVSPPVVPPEVKLVPAFPPQKVMASGDYEGFLAQNQKAVRECDGGSACDEALFNLGFLYSYPRSPYYSQAKGLEYLDRLVQQYPQSVWAFQARAWSEIIRRGMTTHKDKKQKDLQKELKSRDAAINDLQQKIDRSREIDLEAERKERELLK